MISTKDKLLNECHPPNTAWDEFMQDCEEALNISELHSDEWSTEDEALAEVERNDKKRPERIFNENSVIKVHEKEWRSSRVCKVINFLFFNRDKYNICY